MNSYTRHTKLESGQETNYIKRSGDVMNKDLYIFWLLVIVWLMVWHIFFLLLPKVVVNRSKKRTRSRVRKIERACRYTAAVTLFILFAVPPACELLSMQSTDMQVATMPLPNNLQKVVEEISARTRLAVPKGGVKIVAKDNVHFVGAYIPCSGTILVREDVASSLEKFRYVVIHELAHANDEMYVAAGLFFHFVVSAIVTLLVYHALPLLQYGCESGRENFTLASALIILCILFEYSVMYSRTYSPPFMLQEARANYVVGVNTGRWEIFEANIRDILSVIFFLLAPATVILAMRKKVLKASRAENEKTTKHHCLSKKSTILVKERSHNFTKFSEIFIHTFF